MQVTLHHVDYAVPTPSSAVIDFYCRGCPSISLEEAKLFLTHIAALRLIVKSGAQDGIIWDGSLLRRSRVISWYDRIREQQQDFLILAGSSGKEIHAYWISRHFAERVLGIFDRPFLGIADGVWSLPVRLQQLVPPSEWIYPSPFYTRRDLNRKSSP